MRSIKYTIKLSKEKSNDRREKIALQMFYVINYIIDLTSKCIVQNLLYHF